MQSLFAYDAPAPLMVADGMGVDSTAALIGLKRAGIRPDAILMADTGAEKPETYAYIAIREQWLAAVGFPQLTIVRYEPGNFKNWPPYRTLDENCFTNGTLPSLAFGFKSCSQKWKIAPQNKWTESWQPAVDCWSAGGRVRKVIGYDAGPADSRRYAHAEGHTEDDLFAYEYPLREAGLDRAGCIALIESEGLPVPIKSACFMCPASKPLELHKLNRAQPSAGLGRILDALQDTAPAEIVAVEIAPQCAAELFRQERPAVRLMQRDFLDTTPADLGFFDAVAMNPPFHLRADIRHIMHALDFLRPGGTLAALCMDTPHRAAALRALATTWTPIPAGAFRSEGTATATVLLTIKKP